jgi:RHS repeat-associated protein
LPETGLYHFRNRDYDCKTDEFVVVDPSGLWQHGQGNGYSAFTSDAWNRLDPHGLSDYTDCVDECNKGAMVATAAAVSRCKYMGPGFKACMASYLAAIAGGYAACIGRCEWKHDGLIKRWWEFCKEGMANPIDITPNLEHPSAGSGWGHEAGGFGK